MPQLAVCINAIPGAFCAPALVIRPRRFESWADLDRVIKGTKALFSVAVVEQQQQPVRGGGAGVGPFWMPDRKIIVWKIVEDEDSSASVQQTAQFMQKGSGRGKVQGKSQGIPVTGKKECDIMRQEWTEEMFQMATSGMKLHSIDEDEAFISPASASASALVQSEDRLGGDEEGATTRDVGAVSLDFCGENIAGDSVE